MTATKRLYAYDVWANRDVLLSLQSLDEPPAQSVKLLAHIIAAEWLWMGRLKEQSYGIPVWPVWSLDECATQLEIVAPLWESYIDALSPELQGRTITYMNSAGENWTSTIDEVITHVIIHSGYHRGQISALMRASGQTPPYTDFIHATRQGLIE